MLVSTTGDVKLADFGIVKATALADRTAAGARKGRFSYMAPEQLAGEPVTAAADQFGLAVTLFELLAGVRPFVGETPWALLDAIRDRPSHESFARALAPDLATIVERGLAFTPASRFATVHDFQQAISAARHLRAPADASALTAWLTLTPPRSR